MVEPTPGVVLNCLGVISSLIMNNNELEKYALEDPGNVENILEWWRDAASRYPKLSLVARKVLAVPVSSSASESVFSVAGRTITDLRSNLAPETLNSLLFLCYN